MKKRKSKLPSLMLCVSLVIHACVFFLLSFYPANNPPKLRPEQSDDPFALVNLALIEPPTPEAPPPAPEPLPPPLSGSPPELSETLPEAPAESFIVLEELIPVNTDISAPVETPALVSGPAVPGIASPPESASNTVLIQDYVKRNYDYIQRRIQSKLVYPSQARRTGIQGSAELSFTIHEDGRISDVTVLVSSGSELLDAAAMETIYAASPFRPPPAQARLVIPVSFRMR